MCGAGERGEARDEASTKFVVMGGDLDANMPIRNGARLLGAAELPSDGCVCGKGNGASAGRANEDAGWSGHGSRPTGGPEAKEPCQRRRTAMCNRSVATILYIAAKPFRAEALRSDEWVSALARVLAEGAEGVLRVYSLSIKSRLWVSTW